MARACHIVQGRQDLYNVIFSTFHRQARSTVRCQVQLTSLALTIMASQPCLTPHFYAPPCNRTHRLVLLHRKEQRLPPLLQLLSSGGSGWSCMRLGSTSHSAALTSSSRPSGLASSSSGWSRHRERQRCTRCCVGSAWTSALRRGKARNAILMLRCSCHASCAPSRDICHGSISITSVFLCLAQLLISL